jgi:hypothetical protein
MRWSNTLIIVLLEILGPLRSGEFYQRYIRMLFNPAKATDRIAAARLDALHRSEEDGEREGGEVKLAHIAPIGGKNSIYVPEPKQFYVAHLKHLLSGMAAFISRG